MSGTCDKCQRFSNLNHIPPHDLYCMTTPWPFATWGIDVIGKVTPSGSNGHSFVLVAVDYFTKWVEAASYTELTAKKVARFIKGEYFLQIWGTQRDYFRQRGAFPGGRRSTFS